MHSESNYVNAANAVDDRKPKKSVLRSTPDSNRRFESSLRVQFSMEARIEEENDSDFRPIVSTARGEFSISGAGPFTATSFFSFA